MLPILGAVLPVIGTVLDRLIPDDAARAKAKVEMEAALLDAANKGMLAQLDVNKVEAAHRSVFVAGWRPFVGWTCGAALCWHFVLQDLIVFAAAWAGHPVPLLPELDTDTLLTVLLGMLGLGGLRSFEKVKGVTK
jgi:hypothetical protein